MGDSVGTCINCFVHACDPHSHRLTKSEFWCLVCLQKLTLDAAGVPYAEEEEPPEADAEQAQRRALSDLSDDDVQRLLARLASEFGGAEAAIARLANDIAVAAGLRLDDRQDALVRLAFTLAFKNLHVGAGGTLTDVPGVLDDQQLVDPRLRRPLGL